MKKYVFTLFVLLCALTNANAQLYFGGNISYAASHPEYSFAASPEIGYCITTEHSVSVTIDYASYKVNTGWDNEYTLEKDFGLGLCYTRTWSLSDKLDFDIYAGIARYRSGVNCLYCGPMLEYYITDALTLTSSYDALSIENCDGSTSWSATLFNPALKFGFYIYL